MALPFALEHAGLGDDGVYRVTGIMNTFKVTHSRRILHPRGFQNWLKRTRGKATLQMLGNHGLDVSGFATIGQWDRFELVEAVGMRWSGRVGEGTPLADQARTLLDQKLLSQLSVGWVPLQQRWLRKDDADLDAHFKDAMEEAGVDEVLAFIDWYPVEGSIVDVADDPGARIAARLADSETAQLKAEVTELRGQVERLSQAGGSLDTTALLAGLREQAGEFIGELQDAVIEALYSDELVQAAADDLQAQAHEVAELGRTEGDDWEQVRDRLARFGKKA
jgi:hypothetical protein